jgi:uncharacterized membrane protein YphA (DoxX/SURF4 family)
MADQIFIANLDVIRNVDAGHSRSNPLCLAATAGVAMILAGLSIAAGTGAASAHEAWVLTADQMTALLAEPTPAIFAGVTPLNLAITMMASVAFLVGIMADVPYKTMVLPVVRRRTALLRDYLPLFMRLCLSALLAMAALGLMPRHGVESMTVSTLLLPDLDLPQLGGGWSWLIGVQLALAAAFAIGLYVRAAAAGFILLNILAVALFGVVMFDYLGHLVAPAVLLLFSGSGRFAIPLPTVPGARRLVTLLEGQPLQRVMFVVQMMVGATFVYMGLAKKLLQPNLIIGVLESHGFSFLGIPVEIIAFCMAMVEIVVGMLIMFGAMLELVTVALFFCFMFLAFMLNESIMLHIHIYASMAAFVVLGAGTWNLQRTRTGVFAPPAPPPAHAAG